MMVECLDTIDKEFIKQIVLRADGNIADIDYIIKHSSVKEIDEDLFYIKR
jgi:hypothetical protein